MSERTTRISGGRNRRLGHNAERYYVKIFKENGFNFCMTSRLASRLHDNAKIDLVNIPFNIQIKAGLQKNMNPAKELFLMTSSIAALFPPDSKESTYPCFLIHKKLCKRGVKRTIYDEILYMSEKQFKIYQKSFPDLQYLFLKKSKFNKEFEYSSIVAMPFNYFLENIIKTEIYKYEYN